MRHEATDKSARLGGAADLTVVAPIRQGFVPALDTVTYKTRVQRVLRTLHTGRMLAHEHDLVRLLSDAVERVGRIHSVRIALIESEDPTRVPDKVMLAVTFDGPWEAYIRVIWQKVARSLDLIFCNTDGYTNGWASSYEAWSAWLRAHQAETPFLYAPTATAPDLQYLQAFEWAARRGSPDAALAGTRVFTAEEVAEGLGEGSDPRDQGLGMPADERLLTREKFTQGVRSLAGLYRLAELYPPGTDDGEVLHRAAAELLRELRPLLTLPADDPEYGTLVTHARSRYAEALDWLAAQPAHQRTVPPLPAQAVRPGPGTVQGGILTPYPQTWVGCLLLLHFESALHLATWLSLADPTAEGELPADGIAWNVAVTAEGLRQAGLPDAEIDAFPPEFVQGMARRAGLLGDVRANHPSRWSLPGLHTAPDLSAAGAADGAGPRVQIEAVHAVVQLRLCDASVAPAAGRERLAAAWDAREQAFARAWQATAAHQPVPRHLLAVQWMERQRATSPVAGGDAVREHFGYVDSGVDPSFDRQPDRRTYPDQVHLGELLVGRPNAADAEGAAAPEGTPAAAAQALLRDGSFLVVRKLRQDVAQFRELVAQAAAALPRADGMDAAAAQRLVAAKMMGRWPDGGADAGQPLAVAAPGVLHDFDYRHDPAGAVCPLHAHIRRANPRAAADDPPGGRPPRMVRRSMSWGRPYDEAPAEPRGLVFMAYVASLGEQFEVVQRWLAGGNSAGGHSGQGDPLLGVAEGSRRRVYAFAHGDGVARVPLDGDDQPLVEPRPLVRLDWGLYAFTPTLPALRALAARARTAGTPVSWSVERGAAEIARLQALEARLGWQAARDAWKALLEDPGSTADFTAASVWAAVRHRHGGLLRTPYGVLAAGREEVDAVLQDPGHQLTVGGYRPRMDRAFGTLYLGLDAGHIEGAYERESRDPNAAILQLAASDDDFARVQQQAAAAASAKLQQLVDDARTQADHARLPTWEVTFEVRELVDAVLAWFCEEWAGLSEAGGLFARGGQQWTWERGQPVRYPGHFLAPSRYVFWPHPGPRVEAVGAAHGVAVREAMAAFLRRPEVAASQAPLLRAVCDSAAAAADPGYPARTLAGLLMGFLPTTDGNLRRVANEWLVEGTLWTLRAGWARACDAGRDEVLRRLRQAFVQAFQLRTAPDLLWRTAACGHARGDGAARVDVQPGEVVVASLVSAAHACLEAGDPATHYAFGGNRTEPGHPVHACPGYRAAQAVMLGFFQALVASPLALRPGPSPLTLTVDGSTEVADVPVGDTAVLEARSLHWHTDGQGLVPPRGSGRILLAGDSWLMTGIDSLARGLIALGYEIGTEERKLELVRRGKQIRHLATAQLQQLVTFVQGFEYAPQQPRAILLSGGGNDLVDPDDAPRQSRLYGVLVQGATTAEQAIDTVALDRFLSEVQGHYRTLVDALLQQARVKFPILVHGYDHPVPDGEPFIVTVGPWLKDNFDARGIAPDLALRTQVMRRLIQALNGAMDAVAGDYPGRVFRLPLAGTFGRDGDYDLGRRDHRQWWHDELHPTAAGAKLLAWKVHTALAGPLLR